MKVLFSPVRAEKFIRGNIDGEGRPKMGCEGIAPTRSIAR
jgi:hypothetical protein